MYDLTTFITLLHSSVARKVSRLPLAFLRLCSNTNTEKFTFALFACFRHTVFIYNLLELAYARQRVQFDILFI